MLLVACSGHPVLPTKNDIKVSRENAAKDCKNLGHIEGRAQGSTIGNSELALEDLKSDAVKRGANYVQINTMGALGTTIRGTAFICP